MRKHRWVGIALIVALGAAGCSGSTGADSGPTATSPADESPDTGAAGEETSQGNGTSTEELAEVVQQHLARPQSLNVSEPLAEAPRAGTRIAFLECPVASCSVYRAGVESAAEKLDWDVSVVSMGTSPEEVNQAFETALSQEPDAVFLTGQPSAVYNTQLARAQEAGVAVVSAAVVDEATGMDGNGIIALLNGPDQIQENGRLLASWSIVDRDGPVNAAYFTISDFPILAELETGVRETFESECDGCELETINVSVQEIGSGIPGTVVSTLQNNPDIEYLIFGFGDMALGVSAALREAGLTDVRILGQTPSADNIAAVQNGNEHAWVLQDSTLIGYRMVDALARLVTDSDMQATETLIPVQLATAENTDQYDFEDSYTAVDDYQEQFEQLWTP